MAVPRDTEEAEDADDLRAGLTVEVSEGSEMTVGRRWERVLPPSTDEVGEPEERWG